MPKFSRAEVEAQFAHLYRTGCVLEDWVAWANMFTEDCNYVERFWGTMHTRTEVLDWIDRVMKGVPEIYTVLEWYAIDDDKVIWYLQNRRDNPDPDGPPYFDFPGVSIARYAGDGMWDYEEDFWDVNLARATAKAYREACLRIDPDFPQTCSRKFWPQDPVPAWARFDGPAKPSWLGREDVAPVLRPSELGRRRVTPEDLRTPGD